MNEVYVFFKAALPWIAMGLFVAILAVKNHVERSEDTADNAAAGKRFQLLTPMPAVGLFLVALLNYADGQTSNGNTWLILGIVMIALGVLQNKKEEEKASK